LLSLSRLLCFLLQLLFPVVGLGQEASPTALKESDGLITINLFDEVVTPTAAAKAARSAARTGQPGGTRQGGSCVKAIVCPGICCTTTCAMTLEVFNSAL
jgi:hypothetical protein